MSPKPKTKPTISTKEVRKLATLSRLALTESQEEQLRGELSHILDYFKAIDAINEDVPLDRPARSASALRRDEVMPSDPEGVLKGVPYRKGRLVRAPRVF